MGFLKRFSMTALPIIIMTILAWRHGYAAASTGGNDSLVGAIFVLTGFIVLVAFGLGAGWAWRSITKSGEGVSPLRYVVIAGFMIIASFVLLAVLATLAEAGNAFNLGIVLIALALVLGYLAWNQPAPTAAYTRSNADRAVGDMAQR